MNKLKTNQAIFLKKMLDKKEEPFKVSKDLARSVGIYTLRNRGLLRSYHVEENIDGVKAKKLTWRIKDMDKVIEIVRDSLKERVK